ncbi:magnesium transporter [Sphingopyxis sp. H050]|jgi:putative Mg2+ transporter-C (MgtC) family protein|uniref:MgtC/SapB family protein n=1 Tax=Sphingopyxis sp. H050 TaxID=1759072 RepID=UPI0007363941|nr:MgtC/SapB family protein [Sphingopyxis sp. H050]KTE18822.1 magnesium transporter [Sphingopyxis sp. H050]
MIDEALLWPIAGAVLAGAIIGAEREYRASPAGLRTHILVALSCCLLMLSAVHQMAWISDAPIEVIRIDPVRMAHGILTGIGFLCGGVIFREGLSVRGLTTAASLWTTATLGMLFGVGFYELAIFGGLATLLVLAAIGLTERWAPQRRIVYLSVQYPRERAPTAAGFGTLIADNHMRFITVDQMLDNNVMTFKAVAHGYTEIRGDALAAALQEEGRAVLAFEIRPQQA